MKTDLRNSKIGTAARVACAGFLLAGTFSVSGLTLALHAQDAPAQAPATGSPTATPKGLGGGQGGGQGDGQGERGGRGGGPGMGMGMGGRGVQGTVTAATATELTVKTELGDSYKVQFNENTRFMKDRQAVKSSDIKVGDAIIAAGNIDPVAKTVGAAFVVTLDAEQVKRLEEARASYGKTWLGGKITAIDETKITIAGTDGKPASFIVDENTSFKKRKESITLADVKVGDAVTVRGTLKAGTFVATDFQLAEPRGDRGPNGGPGAMPPMTAPQQ